MLFFFKEFVRVLVHVCLLVCYTFIYLFIYIEGCCLGVCVRIFKRNFEDFCSLVPFFVHMSICLSIFVAVVRCCAFIPVVVYYLPFKFVCCFICV